MSKKPKNSRNSFTADINSEENDFILLDLDVNQNEDDLLLVPLNNPLEEEEVINNLFVTQEFDDKLHYDSLSEITVIDDIDITDDFLDTNQFNIGSVEEDDNINVFPGIEVEKIDITHTSNKLDKSEALKETINQLILDSDCDLDTELIEDIYETIEIHDLRRSHDFEYTLNENNKLNLNIGNSYSEKNVTGHDKQISNLAIKKKNNESALSHSNSDLEISDLINIDDDLDGLKTQLIDYKNKIKRASRVANVSLGFGVIGLLLAGTMGVIALNLQAKVSKLNDLNSILEENMGDFSEKSPTITLNNNDQIIGQEKPNQQEDIDNSQTKLIEPANDKSHSSSGSVKKHTLTIIKKPVVNSGLMDNKQSSNAVSKSTVVKKKLKPDSNKPQWTVNLIAFDDQVIAKSKAAKLIKKGIQAKIIDVKLNNKMWYQLKVKGFKNKESAVSYAKKVKKSQNLNSVSVSK